MPKIFDLGKNNMVAIARCILAQICAELDTQLNAATSRWQVDPGRPIAVQVAITRS
jgi:hypothetical protein